MAEIPTKSDFLEADRTNRSLRAKYALTGRFYDLLDYPFERTYRRWRPELLADVTGDVLELGVGTGHNLAYYRPDARVTGIDLSPVMLSRARKKRHLAPCPVELRVDDATRLATVEDASCDWVHSTFMCCVMPDELQPATLAQVGRVLRPGGRFRLLEVIYSTDPQVLWIQRRFGGLFERLYGARFDRRTRQHIEREPTLEITGTRLLKWESYLLIDGRRT